MRLLTKLVIGGAVGLVWLQGADLGNSADARLAKLPPVLNRVDAVKRIYPRLYRNEMARKDGRSWERLRRSARTAWMRSHPCADATLQRLYRLGAQNSWSTVRATWACDGVPASTQSFLTCIAGVEGGRTHPEVWYRGDYPAPVIGWHPEFIGTDRVVNHFQTRPYHASKVAPGIYDRTVTRETFDILTNPINAARIAVMVGPAAYATVGVCS